MRNLVCVLLTGCAASADVGLIQRGPAEGAGVSTTSHLGFGSVIDKVLAVSVDLRGDVAAGGSRFALGASMLGGLPVGRFTVLGRVGVWNAPASTTIENSLVPTLELGGFIPVDEPSVDPHHPERGAGKRGLVFGIREDLDHTAYTTVFVGLAVFLVPGY